MTKTLMLAGGCFWCVEHDLRHAAGVIDVVSGYAGGIGDTPTYEHHEGFREVVLVSYDAAQTSYKKLLQYFIDHIDPTDDGGQFADRGESYTTAIYYENEEEQEIATGVLEELDLSGVYDMENCIALLPRTQFFKGEEYHQNYAEKNPAHYALYREGSGREGFVTRTCALREEKHIAWKA